ncbi:hypothetical protein CORT_0A04420 [Candida orthopsilosis Co 90-125]|uniref:Uncharacterized protein n=1 Tax=Candida orthopsilosis (strain 90-125) TaxID=1136231 RepID=H8WWK6_CANO9|nr:hypothetical protein CORT_0A04420 [Candida orthopsilosis Co 90-125]CCG20830.1 hypothetical protein CORT_0A04420 [Candida orthopsilosis Co 90-125]
MKVIRDKDIQSFLNKELTKESILNQFQPILLRGLSTYASNPNEIVPPRIVQQSNNLESDTTHVFMPCISPNEVGIKVISGGSSNNSKGLGFQGCVMILDETTGKLNAIINAACLTAFRTALASVLGLTRVVTVESVDILPELCVFGVGQQAYWHVKLALLLYEGKVHSVNILNRTLANAEKLKKDLAKEFSNVKFRAFSFEEEQKFKSHIENSSIIFGCTPSTSAVIKKGHLNKDPKYGKFISLIGSYKPHMIELDLELMNNLKENGVKIIVDSKEHTLHEAGELIQSGYTSNQLTEIHELYEKEDFSSATDSVTGITVQKIVGLSIMDLCMGKYIYEKIGDDAIIVNDF